MGTGIAWRLRNQAKKDFLSSNGTQTGQKTSRVIYSVELEVYQDPTLEKERLLTCRLPCSISPGFELHCLW